MKRILRKLFPALFPVTEFVASSAEGLPCMLRCNAVVAGTQINLQNQPILLGYKPLVMSICELPELIQFILESKYVSLEYRNKVSGEKVASLELRVDKIIPVKDQMLVLLVGISGSQMFETKLERLAFRINQRLTKKPPSNIDLTPSEYDQLKIAYSIPRSIRGTEVYKLSPTEMSRNTFPTDLHGMVGPNHFVLSLRKIKRSCAQVEEQKKVRSCLLDAESAPVWYKLGKNHSSDYVPVPKVDLPDGSLGFAPEKPFGMLSCEEMELEAVMGDYEIHRIFLFKIDAKDPIPECPSKQLVHVHRSYANWHKRQGFPLKEIPH